MGLSSERSQTWAGEGSEPPPSRVLFVGRVVAGYTWRLLHELQRAGVEVRAIHRDAPPAMASQFVHESGPEGAVPVLNSDRVSFAAALRFARAREATAIVVLGGAANLPLVLLACALKRPGTPVYLFTDANVPSPDGGRTRHWGRHLLYRVLRPLVREAWTLGRSNELALARYGLKAQRRLPMYATDFAALAPRAPSVREIGSGRLRLLCVARLSPEKNLLALCEALAADGIAGRFELTVVGEGPERAAVERAARRVSSPVRLLGAVPRARMADVFAAADALVLPSKTEPWGIVVVEALGLGIPVVATTRVGAAVSLADRGGVLLSAGTDARSIASALRTLADDGERLRAAARAGAARVREDFGTEPVARRIAALLAADARRLAGAG